MRSVKPEARVLGVDDGPFTFDDESAILIGTVFRGGDYIEAVLRKDVTVDGMDVTDRILEMVNESRHQDQIQAVLLDGITFAGFNIADLERISEKGEVGVVAVSRREPNEQQLDNGLEHVDQAEQRKALIRQAGTVIPHEQANGTIYFQAAGLSEDRARELIDLTTVRGLLPEPVRVSHLIAAGVVSGESRGRA